MKIMKKQTKSQFENFKFENTKQFEKGDGGISYAMYFVAIIMTLILFVFFKFNADLFMIEQTLENGLHIAETGILTSSQDTIQGGFRTSDFEKEIDRLHIVSRYDANSSAKGIIEEAQVNLIGQNFSKFIQDQLELDGVTPKGDILRLMCGPTSGTMITSAKIYEPVYTRTVTKTNAGLISGTNIQKFDFEVTYTIVKWIEYRLIYNTSTNDYVQFEKKILSSAPTLQNGDLAEGATIEATIATEFKGIRNIFAGIDPTAPTAIFSDSPTQNSYSVQVTQSADITLASLDSRQQ